VKTLCVRIREELGSLKAPPKLTIDWFFAERISSGGGL
jgi:hypothetical protein